MRNIVLVILIIPLIFACNGKTTIININEDGTGSLTVSIDGMSVDTETDQTSDGQMEADIPLR